MRLLIEIVENVGFYPKYSKNYFFLSFCKISFFMFYFRFLWEHFENFDFYEKIFRFFYKNFEEISRKFKLFEKLPQNK